MNRTALKQMSTPNLEALIAGCLAAYNSAKENGQESAATEARLLMNEACGELHDRTKKQTTTADALAVWKLNNKYRTR